MAAGLAALLWRCSARASARLLPLLLRRRVRRGKEVPERLAERYGRGAARPPGRLIWVHAASNGETLSVLPVIEAMAAMEPGLGILVTTGTVTSAALLAQRLPAELAGRVPHRFAPLDVPRWVARFLDGWRPDAAVFVESELWPNLIGAAAARGIPMGLVNGRMSARSARWWGRAPGLARRLLGGFRILLAQSEADAARFRTLGAAAECWGNLKYAAPPLPADAAELARLRALSAGRPVWLAASTHPGEEEIVIAAHRRIAASLPDLLTVIVPRHPRRGPEIAALAAGLPLARRAAGEDPSPGVALYVADTLGELGLFYRLARAAFVGGSLVPHGGQNPLEPARLDCPVLMGPHAWNFAEIVARLEAAGGILRVEPGEDPAAALAAAVLAMLSDSARRRAQAGSAAGMAAEEAGLPVRVAGALLSLLPAQADAAAHGGQGLAGPDPSGPSKLGMMDVRT